MNFEAYLKYRGYQVPVSHPWPFLKRVLFLCWAEPGFHRFWRAWNPPFSFLTYRLYRLLGGKRYLIFATLLVFMVCGFFIHDIFAIIFDRNIIFRNTFSFMFFGIFTIMNRYLENQLKQDKWPKWFNVIFNFSLIWISFWLGTKLNHYILPAEFIQM